MLTAIMGEFKIYPIEASTFRLGLGSITFFLLILLTNVRVLHAGFATATVLIFFRTAIDFAMANESFLSILILNIPAGLFYLIFAFCIDKIHLRKLKEFPLQLGILGASFELIANLFEQATYFILLDASFISWKHFVVLVLFAFLRSFFVVGLYSSITITEQKKKMHEMFSMQTNLYKETLYMQQTMHLVEQVTADSFLLYKELRTENHHKATEALRISSEMHEVKKNTQRVVAGLSNLMDDEKASSFSIMQLLKFVTQTHNQYGRYLNKSIEIKVNGYTPVFTKHYLAILSILNNIVSNAVEAIEHEGLISITVIDSKHELIFTIENNGPPIRQHNLEVLFDAGFTTKFDSNGNASTGIGLYHVQTIVQSFNGTISVTSGASTTFQFTLSKKSL